MRHAKFALLNVIYVVVTIIASAMLSGVSRIEADQPDEYFKNFYAVEDQRDANGGLIRKFRWSSQDGVLYFVRQPNDNGLHVMSLTATTISSNQSLAVEIDQQQVTQFEVQPQLFRTYHVLVNLQWPFFDVLSAVSLKNSATEVVAEGQRYVGLAISDVVFTPLTGTKYPNGMVIVYMLLAVVIGAWAYFRFSPKVVIAIYSGFVLAFLGIGWLGFQSVVSFSWMLTSDQGVWQYWQWNPQIIIFLGSFIAVVVIGLLFIRLIPSFNLSVLLILCLFIGLGMQFSAPLVVESQVQKLLSERLTRSMTTGVISTATEPYKTSPFGVDYVVEGETSQAHTFYQTAIDSSVRGTGDAVEIATVFLTRPTRVDMVFSYDNVETARRPRVFAYNDVGKLVDTAALDTSTTEFSTFETPYTASVMLEPGLHRLRMMFARQDVVSINIVFNPDVTSSPALSFDEYVIENTKTLYFDIMPGQLTRLDELRAAQEINWSRLPTGDWSKRFLPSPKESIQVKVRSEQGSWAFAELSLSGRNSAHKSVGGLPSSDISIKAGELPYGLKKFKLYVVQSKSNGYDMFMERFINEMGTTGYRQDIVKIVVNNQIFGYMQLHEDWDTSLFEAGQFVEGPVIGYDTDSLIANPGHSWFRPRSYYNSKLISVDQEIDVGSLEMVQRYCPSSMSTTLASGIFYGGMHGLGADTRFLFDFRRHCVNPVYKDMNNGVLAPKLNKDDTYNFDQHPAILALRTLSVLTPQWRPYTPTYASYFVTRNQQLGSNQSLYYYWTMSPPVMNYSTDEARDSEFFMAMERLYSDAHTQRFLSRKSNYERAITLLNAQPYQSSKLQSPANPPLLSDVLSLEVWRNLVTVPTACDDAYIRTLIYDASGGVIQPDCRDVHRYVWRNELVRQLLQKPMTGSAGVNFTTNAITQSHVTFLYQKDRGDVVDMFFVQRNCESGCDGRLWLSDDETQQVITPKQVTEFGTVNPSLTQMDLLLADLVPDEHVRVFHFVIEKSPRYQHLLPQFDGDGVYFGSHGVAIMPLMVRSTHPNSITAIETTRANAPLEQFFQVEGNVLTWKENQPVPNERIYIPAGYTWKVTRDTTISLERQGCFEIWGDLDIDASARLELTDTGNGWSGIRFFLNQELSIQNLYVSNGGYSEEFVYCGGRRYTGVVGFYETIAKVSQLHITDNMAEDALHLVHTDMILSDSSIRGTMSDAVDSDFSAVVFRDFQIEGAGGLGTSGGDALDFSGSLAELHGMRLFNSSDKNISCGENSIVHLYDSELVGGIFGVAIKDASTVELNRTKITGAKTGIGIYSKKPYYVRPVFDIAQQDVTFVDVGVNFNPNASAE